MLMPSMQGSRHKKAEVLIAGGGIAGLVLAQALRARGQCVVVADDPSCGGAWSAAVGLLNPLRGKRYTLAWRAAEVFAVARTMYAQIPSATRLVGDVSIVRPFGNEEARSTGLARMSALAAAGFPVREIDSLPAGFVAPTHGGLRVEGGAIVHAGAVVAALRHQLITGEAWIPHRCRPQAIRFTADSVTWTHPTGSVTAGRLVLTGGVCDRALPWFDGIPLRPLKGESLMLNIPDLNPATTLAGVLHLAARPDGAWSCGGTKVSGVDDSTPTEAGRAELEAFLAKHVSVPWRITGHHAGVRAMPCDMRPVAGPSLTHPLVSVLNGLGAQGVAYAPWVANVFVSHLLDDLPIPAELSPERFRPRRRDERWHAVDLAHAEAAAHLQPGDLAIDLTAGNGGDTEMLARAVGDGGRVLAIDIQHAAIEATERRLRETQLADRVSFACEDHARVGTLLKPADRGRVSVAIANLGTLPGSTSLIATHPASTVAACAATLECLGEGGALIVVIYTGTAGVLDERNALERWFATLDATRFHARFERHPGGATRAPCVLVVERISLEAD